MDRSLGASPNRMPPLLARWIGAGITLLLAGCAANYRTMNQVAQAPAYVPPPGGATATLLVRVEQPGGHYAVSLFEQPVSCSHRREITSGTASHPDRIGTQIAAAQLQTVSFSYRNGRQTCEVTVSFEPARAHTYVVRASVEQQRCSVNMADTAAGGRNEVPAAQREVLGFARVDSACRPLTTTVLPRGGGSAEPRPSVEDFRQLLPGS